MDKGVSNEKTCLHWVKDSSMDDIDNNLDDNTDLDDLDIFYKKFKSIHNKIVPNLTFGQLLNHWLDYLKITEQELPFMSNSDIIKSLHDYLNTEG